MLPCNAVDESAVLPLLPQNLQVRASRLIDALEQDPNDVNAKLSLIFLSTCHLYSAIPLPLFQRIIVVIAVEVLADGLGDYYHALSAIELIHEKFPVIKLCLLAFFENIEAASKVRKPNSRIATVFSENYMLSDKVSEWLENADQIIEMSVKPTHPGYERLKDKKINIFFGEYGRNSNHAMGLGKNNTGIIIKDKPTTRSIIDIQHPGLKDFLFKTQTPSEADLELYRTKHALFIGYLKKGSYYQTGFIYTLAAYLKSSSEQTIDILIPSVAMDALDTEFLRAQGIGKITSIALGKVNRVEEVLLDPTGKELRLIDPFPLEQKDLHTLLAYANKVAGCAGDQSFTEVASFDRLPFFENHEWKDLFYEQLIELAGTVGAEPHYLKQYFAALRLMYDVNQEDDIEIFKTFTPENKKFMQEVQNKQSRIAAYSARIAELMQQEELYQELHAFNELLREHYSFAPVLSHIVKKQIAVKNHPELQKTEREIEKAFCRGRIDLTQAIEQLTQKINTV